MSLSVVILAAGNGSRMHSPLPKVLHTIGGVTFLERVINTASNLNPNAIHVVYGNGGSEARNVLSHLDVNWVEQPEPLGTGHALMQALPLISENDRILVLYGDVPLITAKTLDALLNATPSTGLGLLTAEFEDPTGFGRIIRNQEEQILAIIEQKEANQEQQQIREINTGIMTAPSAAFNRWLPMLKNKNAQQEYYLTDVVALAAQEKLNICGTKVKALFEVRGVNTRKELISLERIYQRQVAEKLLDAGVTIVDPNRFDCRGNVDISADVFIDVDVILEGKVTIGKGSKIGPYTLLRNATIGENVTVNSHSVVDDAVIENNCQVGPFARIRPHTHLKQNSHVGNFVELKNTVLGVKSKANHLSYLGDADIGDGVNVGAGTITCNYDGEKKSKTIIQDKVFIGSGTQLVAPLVIGEGAYVGAGSTITKDVPENELTLARAKQCTVKGWVQKKKNAAKKSE